MLDPKSHATHRRRQRRARRLRQLAHERLALEAELEADGCRFAGRVLRRHRELAWALEVIHAETFALWEAA